MKYIWYDRRTVDSTEEQFFHESRGKHTDAELGTNMEKDLQFPRDVHITKIAVRLQVDDIASTTQKDLDKLDDYATFLETAIMQIQVGDGPIMYFPLAPALVGVGFAGALQYTQATAADGTCGVGTLANLNGSFGIDVDITVPANTDFKFYIKQGSATDVGKVEVLLFEE